ncbi:TetR/AcrR family transcriptional regulator [Saccharopolyspora oryzae]|uniref:TetR/AcrR family transcriptional regulator n=1 Tax=Saccharopolyspora oryzae TaxID=2997343 RepID=A0ABT4V0Q2_9PSEU|nr:TetR/AcrR family transcriptional regulator [Saccharopolyspora oryzae]MDA3627546.1 TetR/AcrR family transcriptional regulator [Saccharopolyspora oryzae]
MARPRLHSLDDLLDVAEQLVTSSDPAGLTLRALATSAGASNGTIYHAFRSKEDLLAKLWLRAWSRLGELMNEAPAAHEGGIEAVVAVSLVPAEFVRRFPTSAQLFFTQRRDQLFSPELPADVAEELNATQQCFVDLLISLARGVWDRGDREAVEAIAVCVVDVPGGILRRALLEGRSPDEATGRRIEAAVRAILALDPPPPQERGSR